MTQFIEYPSCSTCKKAKLWLEEQLRLLATDGMLVKRPILITDQGLHIGFKAEEWKQG